MLADPRADALVTNFASQWLFLRELQNARPDSPDFDGNLRQSFQRETEMLFRTILREDRSIVDLLDADFTFVDERLARHYGIPGVRGSRTRRVQLAARQPAARPAGSGQHPHGDVGRQSHVAGAARQVGARERARRAAAAAAAGRGDESRDGRGAGQGDVAAPADGAAPRQSGVRVVPLDHGPDRVRARELRPRRQVADDGRARRRSTHRASWWTARSSMAPSRCGARCVARADVFAEVAAEKMLTYAVGRALRPQDMPSVRAITRGAATDAIASRRSCSAS